MAQAYRTSRIGRLDRHGVPLEGSYSFEQKITVEWERQLGLDEFDGLLSPILAEPRAFAEISTFVSGALRACDPTLPPGRISKYRVSGRSLRAALDIMVAAGRLSWSERPGSFVRLWSRTRS